MSPLVAGVLQILVLGFQIGVAKTSLAADVITYPSTFVIDRQGKFRYGVNAASSGTRRNSYRNWNY